MKKEKKYDLEERTFAFARDVRSFIKKLPYNTTNYEDGKQLIRASGSVGGNYIEANEALGKKDFLLHLRISRKEAKESAYWLRLIKDGNSEEYAEEAEKLYSEANELKLIFSSIIDKSK